ncbi:glycosyltransferase family 39 protein [Arthrobacter gandavensis]|uniref:glycosyltransferase family 39 protein n=1 Tax=Arthrobacter gandavensis TaxID=169960 RepID=UPI00188E67A1|nr:glycosyltransferase family 39 protein [Arthrobacter gandavensis]MBF4994385.1 glycosyltransferase family 39 protein [Arthrobacter gandavensis]
MAKPLAPARPPGTAYKYSPVLGTAAALAAYVAAGIWTENRIFQVAIGLAAGLAVWQARAFAVFYLGLWRKTRRAAASRRQNVPLVALTLVFCALTLWGLVTNLVHPLYGMSKYAFWPVVAGVCAASLLLPAAWSAAERAADYLSSRHLLRAALLALFFAGFFVLQVRIGFAVRVQPGWDAQAILDSAAGLATGSIANLEPGYFTSFSNNLTLTLGLTEYFRLALLLGTTDLLFAAVVLNCIVLTLGAVLTYIVARRVGGEAAALFTLLPSTVFVLLSPWIMVAYSDALGLIFPILLFYLYLVQAGAGRWWLKGGVQASLGIIAVIGYNIKPTIIIVLFAIAAVALLGSAAKRRTRRELVSALAGTAVVVASYTAGSYVLPALINSSDKVTFDVRENEQTFPAAHYLNMGAQAQNGKFNPLYGAWYGPDVGATASMPVEERTTRNLESYLARVDAMGASGYISFLSNKFTWFMGDGSFFVWGEGSAASHPFIAEDATSQKMQSYYGYHGENYAWLIGLWQVAWFVVLGLLSLPLVSRRPGLFTRHATIMRVALLGLFVFLLLFEARSRYLYLYMPFFIVLASLSASVLSSRTTSIKAISAKVPLRQQPDKPVQPPPGTEPSPEGHAPPLSSDLDGAGARGAG